MRLFICVSELLDADAHRVARFAIHCHDYLHFAAPSQATWQACIDLIEADQGWLQTSVEHGRVYAADADFDIALGAAMTKARAEADQKELFIRSPQFDWHGDKTILRGVKPRYRLEALRAIRLEPQYDRRRNAAPIGIGGKQAGRNRGNRQQRGGEARFALIKIERRQTAWAAYIRRNLIIDLARRDEKERRAPFIPCPISEAQTHAAQLGWQRAGGRLCGGRQAIAKTCHDGFSS